MFGAVRVSRALIVLSDPGRFANRNSDLNTPQAMLLRSYNASPSNSANIRCVNETKSAFPVSKV